MAELARYDKNKGPVTAPPAQAPSQTEAMGMRPMVRNPEPQTPVQAPQASTAGLRWAKGLPARVSKAMGMNLTPAERTETLVRSLNPVRTVPNLINQMVEGAPAGVKTAMSEGQGTMGFPETSIREMARTQQLTNADYGGVIPNMLPNIEKAIDSNAAIREQGIEAAGAQDTGGAGLRGTKPSDMPLLAEAEGRPSGGPRIFTDAANARFNGITVDYDEATGQNTYTDAGGNIINPADFDPQGLGNEGPRLPGAEYDAFTPAARPGLTTIPDESMGVIAGTGRDARILGPTTGMRDVAAGGGGGGGAVAPGGGGAPGGGAGFLNAEDARNLRAMEAGLPQVQAEYDAAVASGKQERIDRAKLALLTQKADMERLRTGEGLRRGGYPDQIDVRTEMLKSLPAPDGSVETEVQRRRILSQVAAMDQAAENADIEGLKAQASYRTSLGPTETEAQRAQRLAAAEKDTAAAAETRRNLAKDLGVVFENAFDATGNPIPGQSVTMPEFGLSIPATQWNGVQNRAYQSYIPAMRQSPEFAEFSEQEMIREAIRRSLLDLGATTTEG